MTETKRVTRAELARLLDEQMTVGKRTTIRAMADAIFDALPADPPASGSMSRFVSEGITDPDDPPAMTDVDAAREALVDAITRGTPTDKHDAAILLDAFEAAIRLDMFAITRAAIRAEGLDVEAVREWLGPCCTEPTPGCVVCGYVPDDAKDAER